GFGFSPRPDNGHATPLPVTDREATAPPLSCLTVARNLSEQLRARRRAFGEFGDRHVAYRRDGASLRRFHALRRTAPPSHRIATARDGVCERRRAAHGRDHLRPRAGGGEARALRSVRRDRAAARIPARAIP